MKKLILLLSLTLVYVGVQAQDITVSSKSTYGIYTTNDSDADTIKGATTLSKEILVKKEYLYFYDVIADIDTLTGGGGNSLSCVLWGSNDKVHWFNITDVTFNATADTVIRYTDVSTGVLWNYLKQTIAGDGASAAAQLMSLDIKIAPKPL